MKLNLVQEILGLTSHKLKQNIFDGFLNRYVSMPTSKSMTIVISGSFHAT